MSVGGSAVEIVVVSPQGERIGSLDEIESATYTRGVGQIGGGFVTFDPARYPRSMFPVDGRLEFWRDLGAGRPVLDTGTSFFIRRFEYARADDGSARRTIGGPSAVELLTRRVDSVILRVDNLPVDDAMRLLFNNAFVGAHPGSNNIADLVIGQTRSLGPLVSKVTAWRNILELFQEFSDESLSTTPIFFDVVRADNRRFLFSTYIGQRGADHGSTSDAPITFSASAGGLAGESLVESYEDEITDTFGTNGKRTLGASKRRNRSPIGRRESYVATDDSATNAMQDGELRAELNKGRPSRTLAAELVAGAAYVYGRDWGFGDRVVAEVDDLQLDAWVNAVTFTIDGTGAETVSGKVESVDAIG